MHATLLSTLFRSGLTALILISGLLQPRTSHAQDMVLQPEYSRATVVSVTEQMQLPDDPPRYIQQLRVKLEPSGEVITLTAGNEFQPLLSSQLLRVGARVVVANQTSLLLPDTAQETSADSDTANWVVTDVYRLPVVGALLALFVTAVLAVGRWQGLASLAGMSFSFFVLIYYAVPRILSGNNPLWISLTACFMIATVTLYLAHGYSKKTHVALTALCVCLAAVAVIATLAVQLAGLVGMGSEEAFFLQYGSTAQLNLQGLLLGGIMLGALGVLDDITVAQSAVVFQLAAAKRTIGRRELFQRAMVVGRDHVASLVNTLVLAYVGANMALFLLFNLNEQTPLWVALNGEMIVEEVIRTLAGSLGLVLAVPLTTVLAVYAAKRWPENSHATSDHGHAHTH